MIYIHGYYGYQNCGDEAFKCVFNKYLKGFDFIYTSPKNPPPKEPSADDFVILGGGNVIDSYFLESLKNWHGKILAVGVGLSSLDALSTLADLKPLCFYVRNKSELELVKSKIPFSQYIPDIVFSLTSDELNDSLVGFEQPPKVDAFVKRADIDKTAVIVLSDRIISYLYVNEGFSAGVESLAGLVRLINFLKYIGKYYNLHFLSFSNNFYHPDDALSSLIASTLIGYHDRISFSSVGSHPSKAFNVLRDADVVLSMKFHSMVFSLIARKAVINLSDAPKCLSLVNEFQISNFSCPMSMGSTSENLKHALKMVEVNKFPIDNEINSFQMAAHNGMLKFSDEFKNLCNAKFV